MNCLAQSLLKSKLYSIHGLRRRCAFILFCNTFGQQREFARASLDRKRALTLETIQQQGLPRSYKRERGQLCWHFLNKRTVWTLHNSPVLFDCGEVPEVAPVTVAVAKDPCMDVPIAKNISNKNNLKTSPQSMQNAGIYVNVKFDISTSLFFCHVETPLAIFSCHLCLLVASCHL